MVSMADFAQSGEPWEPSSRSWTTRREGGLAQTLEARPWGCNAPALPCVELGDAGEAASPKCSMMRLPSGTLGALASGMAGAGWASSSIRRNTWVKRWRSLVPWVRSQNERKRHSVSFLEMCRSGTNPKKRPNSNRRAQ